MMPPLHREVLFMNKKQIKRLENLLDERFEIALMTDESMGNKEGSNFLPNNPDYVYYKGIQEAIKVMGCWWERKDNKHYVYKS